MKLISYIIKTTLVKYNIIAFPFGIAQLFARTVNCNDYRIRYVFQLKLDSPRRFTEPSMHYNMFIHQTYNMVNN